MLGVRQEQGSRRAATAGQEKGRRTFTIARHNQVGEDGKETKKPCSSTTGIGVALAPGGNIREALCIARGCNYSESLN